MKSCFLPSLVMAAMVASVAPLANGKNGCDADADDVSSALRVAYEHFDQELSRTMRVGPQEGLRAFLSRMENYQIEIRTGDDSYIIGFKPSRYPGGAIKGGGAEYLVKMCSHNIESARPYM